MVYLEINKTEYKSLESWEEMPLSMALSIIEIIKEIPESLNNYYQSISDGTIKEKQEEIEQALNFDEIEIFAHKIISSLSNIPYELILQSPQLVTIELYKKYFESFVYGLIFFPYNHTVIAIESFIHDKVEYFLPKTEIMLGAERPFNDRTAIEFTESIDLLNAGKSEGSPYKYAANIVSIICREKNKGALVAYDENKCLDESSKFNDLSMSYVLEVYDYLNKVLLFIQQCHPALYNTGNRTKSRKAMTSSGLDGYGWYASIVRCASGLDKLEEVKNKNFHEWITYLAIKTAEEKYKTVE